MPLSKLPMSLEGKKKASSFIPANLLSLLKGFIE
jgi:hypothetical protein